MRPARVAAVAAALAFVLWVGFRVYRHVRFGREDAHIVMLENGYRWDSREGQHYVRVTLKFERYPAGADLRDVRLRLSSPNLVHDIERDWSSIAKDAELVLGDVPVAPSALRWEQHDISPIERRITSAAAPPPLGRRFDVAIDVPNAPPLESVRALVTATLEWGGVRQDRKSMAAVLPPRGNI